MKTYIQPEMKVVALRTMQVMAGSVPGVKLGSGNVNAASIDSRQDNSWGIWGDSSDDF